MPSTTLQSVLAVAGLLAVGQGLLLVVILLTRRANRQANRLIGMFIAIFSAGLLYAVVVITGYYRAIPHLIGVTYPFPLSYGPLWYLYARSLTVGGARLKPSDTLHFVPFLLAYALVFPYLFESPEWKIDLIEHFTERVPLPLSIGSLLMSVHGIVYLALTIALLYRHLNRLLNFFSDIENSSLRWLRNITFIIAAIWLLVAAFQILRFAGMPLLASISPLVAASASILVFVTGYLGLRQPDVFDTPAFFRPQANDTASPDLGILPSPVSSAEERYSKSGLTEERKEKILRDLLTFLDSSKPYLKSTLTLGDLAEALSVSEHNLSEVINTGLGQTFFDMVNSYRVREVQHRLKEPANRNFTLTAIAFDAGFNSKSSFNAVFKKVTGITPSEYKRTVEQSAP